MSSVTQKKEIKRLVIACSTLLALGIAFFYLYPIAKALGYETYDYIPKLLIDFYLIPFIWLVIGWTIMQVLAVLGVAKSSISKYNKAIYVALLVIVLLYALIMLPFFLQIEPPIFLQKILLSTMMLVSKQTSIFVIPGIIFWLTKPIEN